MENLSTILQIDTDSSLKIFAGDLFGVQTDSLKDEYLIRIARSLDFDFFLPGDKDIDRFETLQNMDIPVVLANLERNSRPLLKPYIEFPTGSARIIIVGLWSEQTYALLPDYLKDSLRLSDWQLALNNICGRETAEEDIYIVVTHGPAEFAGEILGHNDQIDLVLCANAGGDNIKPAVHGYQLNMPSKSGIAGMLEIEIRKGSLSKLSGIGIENFSSIPILQNSPIPVPVIKNLVDEYYAKWYELVSGARSLKTDKVFLGNKFCGKCHPAEYESWKTTPHATAFEVLKSDETRCLPCHTTGFGYPTGYWNETFTPKMAGIGCEECHYVPKKPIITGEHEHYPVSENNCRCHVPPHDKSFNYAEDKLKVIH